MAYSVDEQLQAASEEKRRQEEIESLNRQHDLDSPTEDHIEESGPAEPDDLELIRQQQLEEQRVEEKRKQNAAVVAAKQQAARQAKKLAKRAAVGAVRASAPYWLPVVLVILGLIAVVVLAVIAIGGVCNASYTDGLSVASLKAAVAWLPGDVCAELTQGGRSGGAGGGATFPQPTPTPPQAPPTSGLTDAQARAILAAAGITVNAPQPQTSLHGIQQATLDEVISLKSDCIAWAANNGGGACNVIVTGGTETTGGHAGGACSHLSGRKIDIGTGGTISQYIRSTFTRSGSRNGDPRWRRPSTQVYYVDEGNHWDIGGVGC